MRFPVQHIGILSSLLVLFIVGSFYLPGSYGQSTPTGEVVGVVYDRTTDEPLPGVNVFLPDAEIGAVTDGRGRFELTGVPEGEHKVAARLVGFSRAEADVTVRPDEVVSVDFALVERTLEMDELVIRRTSLTGGRTRLDEIPGSAHYLSPVELERAGYNDIHRILRSIPGVNIMEEEGYGLRPNIGLRGTGVYRTSKITVMEDGVLVAPAPYAAPAAYYFPTAGRMHGVEVRKGSSQIKYGPYTTGGAVNLISTPIPSAFSGRADVLAGEHGERNIHVNVGDSYTHGGFLVEGFQTRADGFKQLPGEQGTGFDKRDYLAKLRVNTGPEARVYQSLQFKVGLAEETSNETYLGLSDADFAASPFTRYRASEEDVMNTEHRQLQLRHFIQPAEWLDVTTTAYINTFQRNWYKLDRVRAEAGGEAVGISSVLSDPERYADELSLLRGADSTHDQALELKNNNREYVSQGVQALAGLRVADGHEMEIGLRYHEDEIDRFQWVDFYSMEEGSMRLAEEGTPGTESNRVTSARAIAAFGQYRAEFGALAVTPGLRYEHINSVRTEWDTESAAGRERTADPSRVRENTTGVLLPGIGLDYDLSSAARVFGGVHRGFSPPTPQEGARPENSVSYELGGVFQQDRTQVRAVFFFNDYSNLLGRDMAAIGGDPSGEQFNGGEVHVWGLELTAGHDLGAFIPARLSIPLLVNYTLTQGAFQSSFESDHGPWGTVEAGDALPYQPPHQLSASLGVEGFGNFSGELRARYIGTMRTHAGSGTPAAGERVDAHLIFDASLDYGLTSGVSLFGSVRNLTDEVYATARRPAGLRPGLPRTMLVGIKAQF